MLSLIEGALLAGGPGRFPLRGAGRSDQTCVVHTLNTLCNIEGLGEEGGGQGNMTCLHIFWLIIETSETSLHGLIRD